MTTYNVMSECPVYGFMQASVPPACNMDRADYYYNGNVPNYDLVYNCAHTKCLYNKIPSFIGLGIAAIILCIIAFIYMSANGYSMGHNILIISGIVAVIGAIIGSTYYFGVVRNAQIAVNALATFDLEYQAKKAQYGANISVAEYVNKSMNALNIGIGNAGVGMNPMMSTGYMNPMMSTGYINPIIEIGNNRPPVVEVINRQPVVEVINKQPIHYESLPLRENSQHHDSQFHMSSSHTSPHSSHHK